MRNLLLGGMAYQGIDRAPLLPASWRHRLGRSLLRAGGGGVLLACFACGLALVSWSPADPSLSHVTSAPIGNLLGPLGAILADLLMQLLGLAAVLLLLPPLFWAVWLGGGQPLPAWRSKLALAPVAVVALAGAISALPISATWSLHHGNGGMLGDLAFSLMQGALALLHADKAGLAAGLALFAGGAMALLASLGLAQSEWRQILPYPPSSHVERLAGAWRTLGHWLPLPRLPAPPRAIRRQEPPMYRRERARVARALVLGAPAPPDLAETASAANALEETIDPSSRAIAQRFAPPGKPGAAPSLAELAPCAARCPDAAADGAGRPRPVRSLSPAAAGDLETRPGGKKRRASGAIGPHGACPDARRCARRFWRQGRDQGRRSRTRRHAV